MLFTYGGLLQQIRIRTSYLYISSCNEENRCLTLKIFLKLNLFRHDFLRLQFFEAVTKLFALKFGFQFFKKFFYGPSYSR